MKKQNKEKIDWTSMRKSGEKMADAILNYKKITKEQFNLFQKECEKWQTFFGLNDWRISYYDIGELSPEKMAEIGYDRKHKTAWIYLSQTYKGEYTDKLLVDVAKHEMIHLFLADLKCIAQMLYSAEIKQEEKKYIMERELPRVLEGVVNKLSKLI